MLCVLRFAPFFSAVARARRLGTVFKRGSFGGRGKGEGPWDAFQITQRCRNGPTRCDLSVPFRGCAHFVPGGARALAAKRKRKYLRELASNIPNKLVFNRGLPVGICFSQGLCAQKIGSVSLDGLQYKFQVDFLVPTLIHLGVDLLKAACVSDRSRVFQEIKMFLSHTSSDCA